MRGEETLQPPSPASGPPLRALSACVFSGNRSLRYSSALLLTLSLAGWLYGTNTTLQTGSFVLAVLGGIVAGCSLASCLVTRSVNQLVAEYSENALQPTYRKQAPRTGIAALDSILKDYHERISHLLETLESMGGETETLIERYQVLTENLAAAVVIRDEHGKITYCSPYTEPLTGYSLSEIHSSDGDFFLNIAHDQDREIFLRAVNYTRVGEPFQFRYRLFHKTGIEIWAETRTVPILNDEGNVISSLSITLDVTRSVRQQSQLEEKNRDLEDFSYMMSHDLKAPIYTIKGMVSILTEDHLASLQPDAREALDFINKAANRLELLVTGVLEYSRISTHESVTEPLDPAEVINEVLGDFKAQLDKVGASVELQLEMPQVMGDRLKLYQIFSNLVGNSIKYRSERNLRLTFAAESLASRRMVKISVGDNGLGIPKEKVQAILRPFQRAHGPEIEGSGIGLACVKKLLDKLGGTIEVKSELGSGSTFEVYLKAH
jgi:PAS domain S-box-containing protein